jgi:GntR family histidine utilization transcriptional repressor
MPASGSRPPGGAATLHQQVKDHLRARIFEGQWQPGHRVPSEHELVAELGVSRMTVHRALRELAEQGVLVRHAGVGSFVAEPRPQAGLLGITSIPAETRARGHEYGCDLVRLARESATLEVATALGLRTGDSVFHGVCVHRENGVPVQLEDRFVNPAAAPDFLAQDFSRSGFSEYLVATVPLEEVEHVVDAVQPSAREAELLEIRPDHPCLVLTRRTWSGGGVVTFVRCVHPGSRYRLGSRFRVSGALGFG